MNKREFKSAIRNAGAVFGWVKMDANDGEYLQIVKKSALIVADNFDTDDEIDAVLRENGDLYIN